MGSMTLRNTLEQLAAKWTATYPGGAQNRNYFFGQEINTLLASTADIDLEASATSLADNWGNAGMGVPDEYARVRGYFAFDLTQSIKANPTT